jgi:hypothetical protein
MGILFLFFLRMSYAFHIFLSHLRNILTIFPLVEAYLERHHGRYYLVQVLDGVFIHESQYTPLAPNEKAQLPWVFIIHKAKKCLTAIMCHYSHALRLLYCRYIGRTYHSDHGGYGYTWIVQRRESVKMNR